MKNLTIDGIPVQIEDGSSILDAARQAGIEIPTLCFFRPLCGSNAGSAFAPVSCQVCVVKVNGRIAPACSTKVQEGMVVLSENEEVKSLRKTAFELLFSDHQGDCFAPCQLACPAGMDIPAMLRAIARNDLAAAMSIIWDRIALPSILGRICSRPCEKVCRRGKSDSAVSICQLKRYVADTVLGDAREIPLKVEPVNGKRIAIIGAGPSGLSAAWYLARSGCRILLLDQDPQGPGGRLKEFSEEILPRDVMDCELNHLLSESAPDRIDFHPDTLVDFSDPDQVRDLEENYDAILLACGTNERAFSDSKNCWGITAGPKGIAVDPETYQTAKESVFAIGTAVRGSGALPVRSAADGREAAEQILLYLCSKPFGSTRNRAFSRMKKTDPDVLLELSRGSSSADRKEPKDAGIDDFSMLEAKDQAERCFHCDCRGREKCRLLAESKKYAVQNTAYEEGRKAPFQIRRSGNLIYEPAKCIKCGLCIAIAKKNGEKYGLAFIGRGFDVRIDVPFGHDLKEALEKSAKECVEACPTGALVREESADLAANHSSIQKID
ncbi:MAG: FAD-dependent oxidoreductase [Planctomycetia bacterium]|nr:FAD-dependent oxidoreductase [Planctomycetia bacterium]